MQYQVAEEGKKLHTKGNYNQVAECDILVTSYKGRSTNNAFGFNKDENGNYVAVGDFYGYDSVGTFVDNVTRESKKIEVDEKLSMMGYSLEETTTTNDEVTLVYTSWN